MHVQTPIPLIGLAGVTSGLLAAMILLAGSVAYADEPSRDAVSQAKADMDVASTYFRKCTSASSVDDYGGEAVYCKALAEKDLDLSNYDFLGVKSRATEKDQAAGFLLISADGYFHSYQRGEACSLVHHAHELLKSISSSGQSSSATVNENYKVLSKRC